MSCKELKETFLWSPTGSMIILPKGWLYCNALPTNFVYAMSGRLINRYIMFRIMTNSLLWFQAHLCLLIINDLLASLVNYTPHQDFEIQKTKNIWKFSLLVTDKRQSKNSDSSVKNWKPWTGFRAPMLYHWATNSLLFAKSLMVSHLTRFPYIAKISDDQIVMSENGTRQTTLIREIQVDLKFFCQSECVNA